MGPPQDQFTSIQEPQRIDGECTARMVSCDAIKNEFLCAICLGILKKTVTSQECLHRFCQECIKISLQIGNQECPTCRAKLTESNLRADPVFDNLIEKLFPETKIPAYKLEGKDPLESRPENIAEDAYKELLVANSNDKRKITSDENEDVKSALTVEQLYDNNSNEIKKKRKSNRQIIRSPKRRSLRLEALKQESEKNDFEAEYNQRLSQGSAQMFFSSLMLIPNDLKNLKGSKCCSTETFSLKDEHKEDMGNEKDKSNEVEKHKVAGEECFTQEHSLLKNSDKPNKYSLEMVDSTSKDIVSEILNKNHRDDVEPRKRSQRSAALVAQENIWNQAVFRKRSK